MLLQQGHHSFTDCAMQFHILAVDSGWNNYTLTEAYLNDLSPKIKDQLISLNIPDSIDGIIALTKK